MTGTLLKILFQEVVKLSYKCFIFTMAQQPQWAKASSLWNIYDHIQTHHNR